MDDEKIKERQVDLVERTTLPDDPIANSNTTSSPALDSDESFHSGKISFAQKVLGNRFEVLDVLGQGGMGAVYKVRDLTMNRVVALKLLKPELCQDKAVLKRFQSEAAALAELDHENIVSVYDHGITDDGAPYLTMQFLGETTLSDFIKNKGKITPEQAVEITLQICEALDYAHRRKFVHRDIKPSNVIVNEQTSPQTDDMNNLGTAHLSVQLVDFGIAKIVESTSSQTTNLTQTGDVFGTPAYMSPEQCEGHEVDHRSDIYSLGCLLYEMLEGRQPFQGANAIQVAVKHISSKPDRFAEKYPAGHLMNSLEQIVLKCMRKATSERYQLVAELRDDLKLTLAGQEVAYEAESELEEAKKKRNSLLLTIGSVFSGVLGVTYAVFYVITLASLFSDSWLVPAIGEGERAVLCAFIFLSLIFHLHSVVKINYKKRHSFAGWGEQLAYATFVATNMGLIAMITPPIQTNFADAIAVFITASFLYSWTIVAIGFVSSQFIKGANLIQRLQDMSQKKTYVKPKPVLISLTKALVRYFTVSTTCICAVLYLCPAFGSGIVSGLGNMYAKVGSSLAIPAYEFALELNPMNTSASEGEARLCTIRGDNQKAVAVLTAAIDRSESPASLRSIRAKVFHKLKLNSDALQDINKALAESPNDPDFLEQRGELLASQGAFADARRDFSNAISNADRLISVISNYYGDRGLTYFAQGNYKEAVNDFTKALEQNNYIGRERDFVRRALAYNAMGDPISAKQDFREATQTFGNDGSSCLLRAFAAKNIGDLDSYQRFLGEAEAKGFKQEDLRKLVFSDWPDMLPLNW